MADFRVVAVESAALSGKPMADYTKDACRQATEFLQAWSMSEQAKAVVVDGWPFVELLAPDSRLVMIICDRLDNDEDSTLSVRVLNDQYIRLGFYAY